MIKGITPTLAEGGKIKIGKLGDERKSSKGTTYRMPVKLDHFEITTLKRDDKGDLALDTDLMGALDKDFDGHIRALPIVLHSDDIDEVFPTRYAMYPGKKLACSGDGETATRWEFDKSGNRTGRTEAVKCPCPMLDAGKCKPHGILHCSITVPGQAVAGSVHKWRTTSLISIQRLIGSLQQILSTCGTMRGLPLWLKLVPVEVSPDGAGTSTVYVCHIELRAKDILTAQQQALNMAAMRNTLAGGRVDNYRALVQLPAADTETPEEQAEVAEEFFPEESEAEKPGIPADAPLAGRWTMENGQRTKATLDGKECGACDVRFKKGDPIVYYPSRGVAVHESHIEVAA